MKKNFILPLLIALAFVGLDTTPANASFISNYKAKVTLNREIKNARKDVKDVFVKQDLYTNSHDLKKLEELYSNNFANSDGIKKELYFKLIKDTWLSYPEISYNTIIRDIQIDGDYATVQTYEMALATTHEQDENLDAYGELRSVASSIYHLKKYGEKWLIFSEQILSEQSQLKYGDARFTKMELSAPQLIHANDEYTALLMIDLDKNENAIASIDKQLITYPLEKPKEAFRNLSERNELERIFKGNNNNIHEYATASVGISRIEPYEGKLSKVYISGIAFLITRINVIPENKLIKNEDNNAQEVK